MDINIKMQDCKFYVDKEKRTVVCVIENTNDLLFRFAGLNTYKQETIFHPDHKFNRKLVLPNRFSGKAVCSESDEWNEEVGRIVAFDRAKTKLNTAFFKRAQLLCDKIEMELTKLADSFNSYGTKLEYGVERRKQHIKKIAPDFTEE